MFSLLFWFEFFAFRLISLNEWVTKTCLPHITCTFMYDDVLTECEKHAVDKL